MKKAQGEKPLGRPRRRWEDNKQFDLKTGTGDVEYINSAEDRSKFWAVFEKIYSVPDLSFKTRKTQNYRLPWKPKAFANASRTFQIK
jgi:hypothetical protein